MDGNKNALQVELLNSSGIVSRGNQNARNSFKNLVCVKYMSVDVPI